MDGYKNNYKALLHAIFNDSIFWKHIRVYICFEKMINTVGGFLFFVSSFPIFNFVTLGRNYLQIRLKK